LYCFCLTFLSIVWKSMGFEMTGVNELMY
jgi:hypothetical protein